MRPTMTNMSNRKYLYENTDMSLADIAAAVGATETAIRMWTFRNYSKEERSIRKRPVYAASKLGEKNPMWGKHGEEHPNWRHGLDGDGYRLVPKPKWFTGKPTQNRVPEHHVVYCAHHNLTEIPTGYCIHHVDKDKLNNHIDNLQMLSFSAHAKVHMNVTSAD